MNLEAKREEWQDNLCYVKSAIEEELDMPPKVREQMELDKKILEYLISSSRAEQIGNFEYGIYNDIVRGFVLQTAKNLKMDKSDIEKFLSEFDELLDNWGAEKAETLYLESLYGRRKHRHD